MFAQELFSTPGTLRFDIMLLYWHANIDWASDCSLKRNTGSRSEGVGDSERSFSREP